MPGHIKGHVVAATGIISLLMSSFLVSIHISIHGVRVCFKEVGRISKPCRINIYLLQEQ